MVEHVVWSIGSPDGKSNQLVDNYKQPHLFDHHVFDVNKSETQKWPLFHPSEADPDSGYQLHPYTIKCNLDEFSNEEMYLFRIHYLVIAPRLAFLEVKVNGTSGNVYFRPKPSESGNIALHSGLHTTIYSEGVAELLIPGELLINGENTFELISRDGGEFIHVSNPEKIKRLDRMANGAGFIYQSITFSRLEQHTTEPIHRLELTPSVMYEEKDGQLYELCHMYVELTKPISEMKLKLILSDGNTEELVDLDIPKLAFGHFHTRFYIKDGENPVNYSLYLGDHLYQMGTLKRRRKWKVYLSPHSHTDIGYTHRQWEVAERLCRNIDTALDWLEREKEEKADIPAFAYHLDASWVLETYLATRSQERIQQLLKFSKEGRLGIPHSYLDLLTQYASLEDLIRNGEYTEELLRPAGQRAVYTAIVDVPSLSSSLPAIYEGSGVKYLVHANNQDRGPFRLNGGLHRASPYYWEGVNGGKVLVWLSKMYCELRKVCGSPPVKASAERGLEMWLDEYERKDYAPDAVLLYGQEADNTDLDPQPIEFTKNWNQTYAYPQLIACDVTEFFEYVESNFGNYFPVVKGDGGAYWEDGVGSTIAPAIEIRKAQAMLPAAEKLESLAAIHNDGWEYPEKQFDSAWKANLQFVEHTWGAFLSATDPDALLQRDQWAIKEHFAKDGYQWASRLLHTAAVRHSLNWNNTGREIVVYNPHSWTASSEVIFEIARNEIPVDPISGEAIPSRCVQTTATQAIVAVWVDSVPGLSYRRISLKEMDGTIEVGTDKEYQNGTAESAAGIKEEVVEPCVLENDYYRVVIEASRGYVTSLFDKELQKEIIDSDDEWGFGQFLYAKGGEGTRLVGNQSDMPEANAEVLSDFELTESRVESFMYGKKVTLKGMVPFGELEIEWKMVDTEKRLDVCYRYNKQERLEKEAVYIAFPFRLKQAEVSSDSQLGWVNWDKHQLPGGCKEWLPLQSSILMEGKDADIVLASPHIPLFCIGNIVQGKWPKTLDLTGSRVFSYVLNNYWNTNYKASQGGLIEYSYSIMSQEKISKDKAFRFGWTARQPLYGHRISFQDFRKPKAPYDQPVESKLAELDGEGVILTTFKKAKWSEDWILRFQEITGDNQIVHFSIPGKKIMNACLTDLLEKEVAVLPVLPDGTLNVEVQAWGLATVRVELADL
ncbi:polysaccharide lyase family protein [Bacillus sp. JJ1533]|uniref:glycoside hydrolase family 38 N-terminal domain-containing protein n=1 Tax=Bacillus sp. JJ1533 TaxID=3122959 RepID=UPI002FFF7CCE